MVFFATRGLLGPSGTMLSDIEEGELVKLNENGSPVEFYVAKHDYEPDLNGAGRTLLVRKDCYDQRQWHSSDVNAWANCTLRSWLNSTYKGLMDADIQKAMGTTAYRYTPGNGNWTVSTRSDAVFLLSVTELGKSESFANIEGSALPNSKMYWSDQWTRSPYTENTASAIWTFGNNSASNGDFCSNLYPIYPIFTVPSTIRADDTGLIV